MVMLLPGCIFLVVHGARKIDRQFDPPQQPLVRTELFFDHAVSVTARLWPVGARHRRWLEADEDQDEPADSASKAPPPSASGNPPSEVPPVRKKLFVSLFNSGPGVIRLRAISVQTALGNYTPRPEVVILAPQQRVALEAFSSRSEAKIAFLDVTLTLGLNDRVEIRTLRLAPLPGHDP